MATTGGTIARLKQPEYTGENRCLPCTIVNAVIAGVLGTAVGVAVATAASPAAGIAAGSGVLLLGAAAIYLRGYLVPGTPTLTKRYFPTWLLERFGKEPTTTVRRGGDLDPEAVLTDVGALEQCRDGRELCLTDAFREEWYGEIDRLDAADASRDRLLETLDVDRGEVEFDEFGDAFRAQVDGQFVGKWESRPAFLADLGAAHALAGRHPGWEGHPVEERSQLLNGLRLFIDRCPDCGGDPEFGTDTVESCCSTREVAAVSCPDCGARLFESQPLDA